MIIRVLVSGGAVWFASWLLKSVDVNPWWMSLVIALLMGVLNLIVRPIVGAFTSTINFFTLGLFSFVINAALVLLLSHFIPDQYFVVKTHLGALVFSVIVSFVTAILGLITPGNR